MTPSNSHAAKSIVVDLADLTCGRLKVGERVTEGNFFRNAMLPKRGFTDATNGVEVGTSNGRFDSIFLTIERFPGRFAKAGVPLDLGTKTTVVEIIALFGEPFWIDRSDGEAILFYEYENGGIELQFEFGDGKTLSHLTLACNGVLSTREQREAYGVTRSWPFKDNNPQRRPAMPIWLHILLDTVVFLAGIMLWWATAFGLWSVIPARKVPHNLAVQVTILAILALGIGVGRLLSKRFRRIPARCANCGGRSYAEGNRPIRYRCRDCGCVKVTNVSSNWGDK